MRKRIPRCHFFGTELSRLVRSHSQILLLLSMHNTYRMWFVCDLYVICMWFVCDLYVICMWFACDLYVICMWFVCDLYVICMWFVCDLYVICMWFATPCYAQNILYVICMWFVNTLRVHRGKNCAETYKPRPDCGTLTTRKTVPRPSPYRRTTHYRRRMTDSLRPLLTTSPPQSWYLLDRAGISVSSQ